MSKFKRLARVVAGAILATGVLAGTVAPADAAGVDHGTNRSAILDTGWGP